MQLTDRETNAAILAIVQHQHPHFHTLSNEEKSSYGAAAWWWFGKIVTDLNEATTGRELYTLYTDTVKEVAKAYIVGGIRHENRVSLGRELQMTDEEIEKNISLSDLDEQTGLFLSLGKIGLDAVNAHRELTNLADNFDQIDFTMEMGKL